MLQVGSSSRDLYKYSARVHVCEGISRSLLVNFVYKHVSTLIFHSHSPRCIASLLAPVRVHCLHRTVWVLTTLHREGAVEPVSVSGMSSRVVIITTLYTCCYYYILEVPDI